MQRRMAKRALTLTPVWACALQYSALRPDWHVHTLMWSELMLFCSGVPPSEISISSMYSTERSVLKPPCFSIMLAVLSTTKCNRDSFINYTHHRCKLMIFISSAIVVIGLCFCFLLMLAMKCC